MVLRAKNRVCYHCWYDPNQSTRNEALYLIDMWFAFLSNDCCANADTLHFGQMGSSFTM